MLCVTEACKRPSDHIRLGDELILFKKGLQLNTCGKLALSRTRLDNRIYEHPIPLPLYTRRASYEILWYPIGIRVQWRS